LQTDGAVSLIADAWVGKPIYLKSLVGRKRNIPQIRNSLYHPSFSIFPLDGVVFLFASLDTIVLGIVTRRAASVAVPQQMKDAAVVIAEDIRRVAFGVM